MGGPPGPGNTLALTRIADFGGDTISDITIVPIPEPASCLMLLGAAALALLRCRRAA
jgi:hypothetical protein